MPFSVREGINIFLAGFVPTENLRFRDEELNFKLTSNAGTYFIKIYDCCSLSFVELYDVDRVRMYGYPNMTKTMTQGSMRFKLHVEEVCIYEMLLLFIIIFIGILY